MMERAQHLYDDNIGMFANTYYKKVSDKVGSDGFARALIGGHLDSSQTAGEYLIAANNGTDTYQLEFLYTDPDSGDNYSACNYVVDVVYRMCSFSGTSYKPRSYSQFCKEDMGSKK